MDASGLGLGLVHLPRNREAAALQEGLESPRVHV
jgi:hypothetical protein